MLLSPAKLSMRAQVDSMKAMMVERVSNADRARYALRASPNAHQGKDQTIIISLQEREDHQRGGPNLSIATPLKHSIDWPINLATTDKNDCRAQTEMIDAAQAVIEATWRLELVE
jgi:hypothetical protein